MANTCPIPDGIKNKAPGPPAHNAAAGLWESSNRSSSVPPCCMNCFEGVNLYYGTNAWPTGLVVQPDP